mgnify:CR=1 FL=1
MRAPLIVILGKTVADTWARAVIEVWGKGLEVPTEYDEAAKEATLLMTVEEPFTEPRMHVGDLIAVTGIRRYTEEVLDGTLDEYVRMGKLSYTYHERLHTYPVEGGTMDQIAYILRKLREAPYTRRAQAITWRPGRDPGLDAPPCLQRLWFKVYDGVLILQSSWRSRDLFQAAQSNILALTQLQKHVADELGFKVGAYTDFSNSAHIYEKSYAQVERFLATLKKRKGEELLYADPSIRCITC